MDEITVVTIEQALNLAAVDCDDSDLVKDSKIMTWIKRRHHRVLEYDAQRFQSDLDRARADNIELVIVKGFPIAQVD